MTKKESNFLKLIAISSMLLDHIGAFLFPSVLILRVIGRISFPIFAYQLGIGYEKTKNKREYIKRLFIFGLISQVPYYLLDKNHQLNIIFTLALGVFTIYLIEKKKYLFLPIALISSIFVDYSLYGIITILFFYFFREKEKKKMIILFSLITIIFSLYFTSNIQIFAILSLIFIFGPKRNINLPKYFFYIFYPVHLFIIYLIKLFI